MALRAQLAAEQAKTVAAHEAVGRQTAEAKEAAKLVVKHAETDAAAREAAEAADEKVVALRAQLHTPCKLVSGKKRSLAVLSFLGGGPMGIRVI